MASRRVSRSRHLRAGALRVLASAVFAASMSFTAGVTSASATGTYSNASIADVALRYVDQYGGAASVDAGRSGYTGGTPLGSGDNADGECRAFVNAVVWIASGHSQWVGGGSDYFSQLAALGTRITDVNALVKGDVVQVGQGTHTFIIVSHVSGSTFNVVDSNEHYDHKVSNYNRSNVVLGDTVRAYRLGSTSSGTGDASSNLAGDGGFEGPGRWAPYPGTSSNFVAYKSGQVAGESARDGLHYAATNTPTAGGGIYQDVAVSASPGGLYCASAWVRTQAPSTGAQGSFVVWLLGGSYNENGVASFTGLSNGTNWRQVQACVAASTSHSTMRIQFYPTPGSPTLEIDDVDVH